jgi:hypothetical protein
LNVEAFSELEAMDAVAAEQGMILAFRACDESEAYEPVFVRVESAGMGAADEATMLAISDANGMSLGRYVFSRSRLDAALAEAQDSFAADCSSADRLL